MGEKIQLEKQIHFDSFDSFDSFDLENETELKRTNRMEYKEKEKKKLEKENFLARENKIESNESIQQLLHSFTSRKLYSERTYDLTHEPKYRGRRYSSTLVENMKKKKQSKSPKMKISSKRVFGCIFFNTIVD